MVCVRLSSLPIVLLGLVLLFPAPCPAGKRLEDNRQELKQIQQRIADIASRLEKGEKKQQTLEQDLRGVQKQLTRLRAREERHAVRLKALKEDIAAKEAAVKAIRKKSRQRKELVARRLAAIYRGGQMRLLRILFDSRSPAAMAEDYHMFKRVVQHDRDLLAAYRRDQESLGQEVAALEGLQQERVQQMEELNASRQSLQDGRRLKKRMLAKLQRSQGTMNEELAALKEKSARLASLVKRLESAPASKYTLTSGAFVGQKGRLGWPVSGRVKVPFGTGRLAGLGTLYDSQGIEIEVSGNQAIHAIWGGRVIYANSFRGYGNMIIVDHGDNFYTLYAQASNLQKKVGDVVQAGELIGYPGYEDADSVYFEIRHHGTPLDPLAWLKPRT